MALCASDDPFFSVMATLQEYIQMSSLIPGWTRNEDAEELARASFSLSRDAIIVEIGAFLGCCTVLLAGARCVRGSGEVHSVDPFDCSGDAFSVPHYRDIVASLGGGSLRDHFEANIRRAGLNDWVQVHHGRAAEVAATWELPIDLLLLDGDQSPRGAREAFDSWLPFLKPGGIIVLRNTKPREYAEGHDGHRRLVVEKISPPRFIDVRLVGSTTFAWKAADHSQHLQPAPSV
jgi:MMP 1-O-methyltransferase